MNAITSLLHGKGGAATNASILKLESFYRMHSNPWMGCHNESLGMPKGTIRDGAVRAVASGASAGLTDLQEVVEVRIQAE